MPFGRFGERPCPSARRHSTLNAWMPASAGMTAVGNGTVERNGATGMTGKEAAGADHRPRFYPPPQYRNVRSTPTMRGSVTAAKGVPSVRAVMELMPVTYWLSNRLVAKAATS